MTRDEFAEYLAELQTKEAELRSAGQKEYAHDEGNCFANFERVGAQLGVPREQVLMVYALKHLDGVVAYLRGHVSQREGVEGRILDLRLYLGLLAGMIKEREREREIERGEGD